MWLVNQEKLLCTSIFHGILDFVSSLFQQTTKTEFMHFLYIVIERERRGFRPTAGSCKHHHQHKYYVINYVGDDDIDREYQPPCSI